MPRIASSKIRKARCAIGHTHYFNIARDIKPANWARFTMACRAIFWCCRVDGPELTNGEGDDDEEFPQPPEATDEHVRVNGPPGYRCEDLVIKRDGGSESWSTVQGPGWRFVKTNRKSYDAAVVAILSVGRMYGVLSQISSDGEAEDMVLGLRLAREATGAQVKISRWSLR